MRNDMKTYINIGKMMKACSLCCGVATAIALASCTDFSDYNEAPAEQNVAASRTLWENISQNPQLSDFAALVKQTGFEAELNTPRSLTVWAPVNGSFALSDYQGLSSDDLLTQFVKTHIAEYSHAASGKVDERVHMLNDKSFTFAGDGSYTFGGLTVKEANVPSTNGLLHMVDGAAKFYPNLYEYIKSGDGIDLLREHFMRYELTELDADASVKGPMVNGIQTYIDSVMVVSNSLVNQLNARIANEDSSYTFLMPTDKAFTEMYNRVKPYYNFISATKMHDVENYESASSTAIKTAPAIDAAYMTDSLVRRTIVRNLIFSNNDAYNKWLVDKGEYTDTLRSTTRNKFSNPRELLAPTVGEPVEASNGYVRLMDSLAFYPWETYCPELVFEPIRYMAKLFPDAAQMTVKTVVGANGSYLTGIFGPETTLTEYRYGWVSPGGDRTLPVMFIKLPNVMSTTYNFYVVYMPSARPSIAGDSRPNWLNYQLNYCDAKGATQVYNFNKAYADSLLTGGLLPKLATKVDASTAFLNDPTKTDTIFIGRFTFPVNYRGLGEDYYPSIRISSPINVFNKTQLETYSRDIRIAAILLRPVELEEFEAKNK